MTTKRKRNALSAVFVQSVQETGTYADGGGLNLRVEDSGAKFWFQRVTIDGTRRNLGLGGYPTVSLAEARKAALVNSRMIREGRDPLSEKREAIAARQRPPTPTFAEASEVVIDMRRPTWTNAKHAAQWASTLTTYAFPKIGPKLVTDINSADVLSVLTPIWTEKPETASRVRQRMETVLDWAVAQGYRTDNPAARSIAKVLPKTPRTKRHHAALHYRDVPAALGQVNGSNADTITKLAFEFLVLTAARSGEVRLATWDEIDWRGRRWTVPAERMKARREHQVPLSNRSIEVFGRRKSWPTDPVSWCSPVCAGDRCPTWFSRRCCEGSMYQLLPMGFAAASKTGASNALASVGQWGKRHWRTIWVRRPSRHTLGPICLTNARI